MNWKDLLCHHAGPIQDSGLRSCFHPGLLGLKVVSPGQCGDCWYRNRPAALPDRDHTVPPPRWDCALLGAKTAPHAEALEEEHECLHPAHTTTTRKRCAACNDFLFPLLSPRLSAADALRHLQRPARDFPDGWWTWPNVQAAFRELTAEAIVALPRYPADFRGRGVVIVGGGKYFPSAYVTIRVLRHVGCRLPIELWHLAGELTPAETALLSAYDVRCIDGEAHAAEQAFPLHATWWKGWQLKAYAAVHSRFREILYLDADCYPTRDPSFLFDLPAYRERGAVFWPDILNSSCLLPENAAEIFGLESWSDRAAESGQMLIDKEWCWRELNLALFFNAQPDYVYRILWGDKDTFPLAWKRLGRSYARLWPEVLQSPQALLQCDDHGRVLFQHRASDKFRLPETQFDSNRQREGGNVFNPELAHEAFCFDVLEELTRSVTPAAESCGRRV